MSLNQLIDTSDVLNRRYLKCKFNSVNTPVVLVDGDPGLSGQVLKSTGSGVEWSTVTPTGVPGPPNSVLTTNSAGTAIIWSNDAKLNNVDVDQHLQFNGINGSNGQVVVNNAGFPQWSSIGLPNLPIGTPRQLLQTNSGGTAAEWTSNISVDNVVISDDLALSNGSGTQNYVVTYDAGFPKWLPLSSSFVTPGTANQVLVTNSGGTAAQWSSNVSVDGNLSFNGSAGTAGQYVKKSAGTQVWSNIAASDITPGTNGQVIVTSGGVSGWGTAPPSVITPGTAYQIPETDSTATSVEWTSQYKGDSFLLTGNPSNFQSVFSRYYSSYMDLELYTVPITGSDIVSQSVTVRVYYVIMGNCVNCIINKFTIPDIIGPYSQVYLVLIGIPSFLTPARLDLTDFDNVRQSQSVASFVEGATLFRSGLPMINVYYRYYGFLDSAFEFVLDNPDNYDHNGDHGQLFSDANSYELAGPVNFSYFI